MLALSLAVMLQSDADLADRLARRGWTDLAESLVGQDDVARGRLRLIEAEREEDPVRRAAAFEAAADCFRSAIRRQGPSDDALSDLSTCLKEKGRLLATQGGPAAAAFDEAEALFAAGSIAAKHELGLVLLARGQALKSPPHLRRVIDLYLKDLAWLVDGTLLLYELHVQAGRAWQALAELDDREADWDQAFVCFGKARGAFAYDLPDAQEVGARATLLEMRARIRHGKPKSLLEASRLAEDYAKRKRKPAGLVSQLIRLEHGRALGLSGRITQAVAILQPLRTESKGTALESFVLDILAEFAGATNPGLALDAADDLLDRGDVTRAAVKFRQCTEALRGRPDEPRCWLGLGTCYVRLQRWPEAVAALTRLETLGAETLDSGMMKLHALSRIKDLTRDEADVQAYREQLKRLARFGGDAVKELHALELERETKWTEAAEAWLAIASDRALYRAGRAKFMQADAAAALHLFKRHLAKAPTSPEAFRSTVFGARCLIQLGKPDEALALADGAESKWPGQDPRTIQWLVLQRVQAKAAQGRAAEAESDVAAMERIWKKEQAGLDYYSRALAVCAEAWEKAAKDDAGWERAARLWHRYFEINPPDPRKDADRLGQLAGKLVEIASRVKDARDLWSMARDLYAQLRVSGRGDAGAIRRLEARCLVGMGRFEDAVEILRELTASDPAITNGGLWEELADAFLAWGRSLERGSTRTEKVRKALDIYSKLSAALRRIEGRHFWRVTYRRAECLWETDLEGLREFYDDMANRGYATKWDDGDFKPQFEALKVRLEEKLPGRKP